MGAREHVRQDDVKALQCISPTLLKFLAFAVHRKTWQLIAFSVYFKEPTTGSLKRCARLTEPFKIPVELGQVLILPGQGCSEPCSLCRAIVRIT